mmetsp:Transcript_3237/g.6756  ORF Transcript_3237/g.6756 Transcript_3237/m.6756 type:complete len:120 (-) Transcript_3237:208-567(-)
MRKLFSTTIRSFSTYGRPVGGFVKELGNNWQGYSVLGVGATGLTWLVYKIASLEGEIKLNKLEIKRVEQVSAEKAQKEGIKAVKEATENYLKYRHSEEYQGLRPNIKEKHEASKVSEVN